jgi:histidyl-tRNA synthetase
MTQFSAPKGVPDYVPPTSAAFLAVREALAAPARNAGYGYIELPVFEDLGLFVRGVGESTDVVSKEMYTFLDRGGREMGLRPEGTAGVMRAVIEHSLDRGPLPVKLWYAGPFFRAERPQQGRYRQLQQVGVEAIGSEDPALDAEVIAVADEAFRSLGLRDYTLLLTSLGCAACRPAYRAALQTFLAGLDLDEETRLRAQLNPLRVLDDKRDSVQRQLAAAPLMPDFWCADCAEHYAATRAFLSGLGVAWTEAPRLVRGLDYYTRTTFEFSHAGLGAQSGIGGGGRYDGLMASLGGQELSGIGFGIGTDRTVLACRAEGIEVASAARCEVYLVPLGEPARRFCSVLGGQLRSRGVRNDKAFGGRALKGAMKGADRSGARYAVIVGDAELAAGAVVVKDLANGRQWTVPATSAAAELRSLIEQEDKTS